jgi:hypothetical protein
MLFIILVFLLIMLFICSNNEFFNEDQTCAKIPEGECNSKLCPSQCKIQHSSNSDKCYCVDRK